MTAARSTRVIEAYHELKARILNGQIAPGFQASEPEIALLLGMSRTPVREALLSLQSEGLIELIPRRGARVLPLSMDDMREIYEILTALEPEAAAKLAGDEDKIEKCGALVKAVEDMEAALDTNALEDWADADNRFHRELLSNQDNARLAAFVTQLIDQSHRARMMTLRLRELPRGSTADHRLAVNLILAGDVEGVREMFRAHRERASDEMLRVLHDFRLTSL